MAPYIIIGLIVISAIANIVLLNNHKKLYTNTQRTKLSGNKIIDLIFDEFNIDYVKVKRNNDTNNNFYNAKDEYISLSPEVYGKHTVYSVAVAAHEASHVMTLSILRLFKAYVTRFSIFVFLPLLILALFVQLDWLNIVLVILYVILFIYKFITEVVNEYQTNSLALVILADHCNEEELKEVKKVYRRSLLSYITLNPFIFT